MGNSRDRTWGEVVAVCGEVLVSLEKGALAKAEPKTMRYRVLHVAAFLVHKSRGLILRLDETWPWVDDLANAFI